MKSSKEFWDEKFKEDTKKANKRLQDKMLLIADDTSLKKFEILFSKYLNKNNI